MPLRRLSIQWKITLLAGLCLLAIVALLVATSLTQAHRSAALVNQANTAMLEDSARQRLQAHAETQALRIQRYFMDAYQYGNGFARLVQVLKDRGGSDLRAELTRQARASLAGNPDVIGLYLVFQPNALTSRTATTSARTPWAAMRAGVSRCTGPNQAPAPWNLKPCRKRCSATPASAATARRRTAG